MTQSYIDPSKTNFEAFKDLPRDQPIHMLNLLQYRDQAEYPEGHDNAGKDWSGRRAYKEYGKTSGPIFRRVGGEIVWRGAFEAVLTGRRDERIAARGAARDAGRSDAAVPTPPPAVPHHAVNGELPVPEIVASLRSRFGNEG